MGYVATLDYDAEGKRRDEYQTTSLYAQIFTDAPPDVIKKAWDTLVSWREQNPFDKWSIASGSIIPLFYGTVYITYECYYYGE